MWPAFFVGETGVFSLWGFGIPGGFISGAGFRPGVYLLPYDAYGLHPDLVGEGGEGDGLDRVSQDGVDVLVERCQSISWDAASGVEHVHGVDLLNAFGSEKVDIETVHGDVVGELRAAGFLPYGLEHGCGERPVFEPCFVFGETDGSGRGNVDDERPVGVGEEVAGPGIEGGVPVGSVGVP